MEGVEMEHPFPENSSDDFCNTVLSQFCESNNEHHVHTLHRHWTAVPAIDALSTILSLVVPRINQAILRKKYEYLSDVMIQLLGLKTIGMEGIVSCLKCVTYLLVVGAKGNWSDVAQLYAVFIRYLTDDRQKSVAHNCLGDVLQNFQSSPILAPLAPASEATI
ncbi:hypothetical protein HAX54_044411 [Datura stramonium]|uniref:RRP12 N-terminal HEAT domain-containing protein n=1 Tax=Datura stramonium TaxID=4076 RepID=A0ABS8WJD6_DATST|nr:hypothetical protein [Datura stramonium]